MPSLGRLDGDLRGLQVTNLAHHDDVRVLAQERAQGLGEVQPYPGVHMTLVDAFQVDLHRVFRGGNVAFWRVEDIQSAVQGYGFPGTGGPGHQDHALGLFQGLQVQSLLLRFVSEPVDTQAGAGGVQNAQTDFFSKQQGQRVDPEINGAFAGQAHLDTPVLWHPALRDVHLRHHFQAGGQPSRQVFWRFDDFLQYPIGTKAHPVGLLIGFEMNIRGAALDRIQQHLVDKAHHRRFVHFGPGISSGFPFAYCLDLKTSQGGFVETVIQGIPGFGPFLDGPAKSLRLHHYRIGIDAGMKFDFVQGRQVGGVGNRDEQAVAPAENRQRLMPGDQFGSDQVSGHGVPAECADVKQGYSELLGHQPRQFLAVYQLLINQVFDQRGFPAVGLLQRRPGKVRSDQFAGHQAAREAAQWRGCVVSHPGAPFESCRAAGAVRIPGSTAGSLAARSYRGQCPGIFIVDQIEDVAGRMNIPAYTKVMTVRHIRA